jgi:tetratricopeptide (TPR) repeat protein
MRHCLASLVVIAMLVPALAAAQPRPMTAAAQHELERGRALFEAKQYAAAISAFDAGFAIDPHPDFLYGKAQAQRLGGDCRSALATYDAFLATKPPDKEARKARLNIERCAQVLAASTPLPARTDPPPAAHEPVAAPSPGAPPATGEAPRTDVVETRPAVWWRDRPGLVLAGGGAVALATAGTFALLARSAAASAGDAGSRPEYDGLVADHDRDRTTAGVAAAIGAVLVGAAVVRFVWVSQRADRRIIAGATAAPGGAAVWLGGAW